MSLNTVPSSLRDILADTLEISPDEVKPELSAESVETWDSFRHVQLMLYVESEYGIVLDPGLIPELTTVGKIQEALEKKGVTF